MGRKATGPRLGRFNPDSRAAEEGVDYYEPFSLEKGSYGLNRMNDQDKTKEQLTSELAGTRQLVAELKASESERQRVEEALKESEELSRGLLQAATVGTYIVQDGKFQYVNPQFERITGYTRDELLGTYSMEHVHPDDRELVRNKAVELLKGQSILSYEFRFMHKDGSPLWILERVASIEYKGRPAAVGSFMDINERKQAEEALRESEERFKALIENARDAIGILDAEGIIVYESPSVERILGYRPEELIGKSVLALIHPDDLPEVSAKFVEILSSPTVVGSMQLRLRHKDGSWRWMEGMANNLLDNPQVRGIVVNYRDITERKQAEEALHQSEERLRALVENAPDAIHIHDLDARFIDANKKSEELVGYSRDELTSSSFLEVGLLPEEYIAKAAELLAKSRRGEPTGPDELELIRKDGSRVAVEVSSFPVQRGDSVEVINITRDITERKRVQEEMLRHSKRLEALNAISVAVSQSLDLNEMLNSALEKVLEIIEVEGGYIHLYDRENRELVLKAHRGVSEQYVEAIERMELREEAIELWHEYPEPAFRANKIITEGANAAVTVAEGAEGFELFLAVPLWSKSGMHGGLTLIGRTRRRFSTEELDLLKAIGNEIAVGIENARLVEKMRELSITDELTGLNNRRHFYEVIETEMGRTQRYGHSFSVAMLDLDGFKEYNDRFGHTNGDAVLRSLGASLRSLLRKSDTAFRYGGDEFTIIMPATDADRAKKIVDRIRSEWSQAPKMKTLLQESRFGFSAGIAQFPENAETADGLVFLADTALYRAKREGGHKSTLVSDLGTLASGAIDRDTLDHVYALAATVDARDPYTYGHSKRVAATSEMIGRAARLSRDELAHLRGAALLHDIGKVGIPDATLGKPSTLTEGEWEVIKQHSTEGARIVSHVKALAALVPIIKHHHEWYDGTGYPDGLKGERIPVGARIISIADAYDTMTTRRPYREPVSREEALGELRRCCGTQFDPMLVGMFGEAIRGAVWRGPEKKKSPSLVRK